MMGVKQIATIYVDGKEFYQNFSPEGMQVMKQRLIDIGIAEERIEIKVRMPNL